MADGNSFTDNVNQNQGTGGDPGDSGNNQGQGASFNSGAGEGGANDGGGSNNNAAQNAGGNNNEVEGLRSQIRGLEKRLQDKDNFIETLKTERRDDNSQVEELKTQIQHLQERNESIEEILNKFKDDASSGSNNDNGNNAGQQQLSPEDIERLATSAVERKQTEQQLEQNLKGIVQELQSLYNPNQIDEKVTATAQELGMTFDEAFDMAKQRPQAFKRLFIEPNKRGSTGGGAPPSGSVNTNALENNQGQNRERPTKHFMDMSTQERNRAIQEKLAQFQSNN